VESIAESRKTQQEETQTVEQTGETPKKEPKDVSTPAGEVQVREASEQALHAKLQQDQDQGTHILELHLKKSKQEKAALQDKHAPNGKDEP
jgi:hypothetical protein